jgi:hypothetical protein
MDIWNPNKNHKGWLKLKASPTPRKILCYKLICITTDKTIGEEKDLSTALRKAKEFTRRYGFKVMISPVKE